MKIFNWVHNKFHRNTDNYSVCPRKDVPEFDAKKPEAAIKDADREALLDHVRFEDMLDEWKDGILTIGTFGFDHHPLELPAEHIECQPADTKEETNEGGEEFSVRHVEEKVDHLVVKAFKQEFQKVLDSNLPTAAAGSSSKPDRLVSAIDDVPLLRFLESPQILTEVEENDKRKRTTLAELFSADHSNNVTAAGKSEPDEKLPCLGKEEVCHKDTDSLAKKSMPTKGDNSTSPVKKLNRMVTKMLKKKIHPDELAGSRANGNEGYEQSKKMKVKGAKKNKDQKRSKWICLA